MPASVDRPGPVAASAISRSRSRSSSVAFSSTGTTPTRRAPSTAQSRAADEGRQKATRSPATEAGGQQGPGGPALGGLGRPRLVSTSTVDRPAHGSSAVGRTPTGSVASGRIAQGGEAPPGGRTASSASPPNRISAPATVTARTPVWSAIRPLQDGADRVDDPQAHHVDAEDAAPGLGRGPELDHGVEPGQHGDVAGAHRQRRPGPTSHSVGASA